MEKKYKVPIGPVHVGLKEPITAWLDLEGEKIVGATVRPGAIHRGIEFMARDRNPIQVIYLSERICGICSFSHVIAFLRAVEDAASGPVPAFEPELLSKKGCLYLTRPSVFPHNADTDTFRANAADLFDALAKGFVKPAIGARFPLAEVREAHRVAEARAVTGAILLIP